MKTKEKIKKEVKKASDELAGIEKEGIFHKWASVKPEMRPYATQEEEFLDSLARWLTYPEDVCVAVCYDKKLKQLLIASNAKKAKCAEASFFLDISQYFTKELSCVQIYEKLRKEAIEKVYHQLYGKAAKSQANKVKGEKEEYDWETNFKEKIKKYYNLQYKFSGSNDLEEQSLWNEIWSIAEQIPNKISQLNKEKARAQEKIESGYFENKEEAKTLKIKSKYNENSHWEMLMPIDDLNIIFSIMIKDQLDQELIEAIKLLNIDYIENEESMHAEMKIIDKLLELKARGEYYIGITKLTCAICKITIDTINGHEGSISINTRGTHGGTYQGWLIPEFVNEAYGQSILETLEKKLLPEKSKETTSKIQNRGLTSYPLPVKQVTSELMGKTVGEIEDIEMQEVEQWTNVHPSFASQLVQSWIDHNFTYQQTQEWIQAGLQSTEANLAAWLRDEKSKDLENFAEPEWLKKKINTGELNLNELRQAHQEEINDQNNNFEQQAQIQIPPKI